ncbi:unnamed protein product [Mytilus coruscus]|uniref:Integrase catalytic domain-containing protein n=1 Tax=Mytilus coruscus TaxID=42192 RepID=A0A6J8DCY4_MYTCO|nr:unnamed protein product [Mytilus coruscus]
MFNELLPTKDRTDVFETCVLGHLWNTDIDVIYVKSAKNTMCSGISTKTENKTRILGKRFMMMMLLIRKLMTNSKVKLEQVKTKRKVHLGRFINADISECAKFPILLPRGETFTRILVEKNHKELLHSGVYHTLCRIRNKFWIPQGRATVTQILRHCKTCKRFEGGSLKMPNMAPFPRSRVSRSLPFEGTGLDYLGPVYVKDGTMMKKRWICLFTCFVTRAIHLEIVNDMTTEEFICAFRRFVPTRGTPSEVISDNASQLKLGETIKSVWENTIIKNEIVQNYMSSYGIQWKFLTELAPSMGGFYERLVGLVKRCLRKTLRKRSVSDVQILTLLKEIEAVINSRPSVYGDEELK